jgi:hypothetical protein
MSATQQTTGAMLCLQNSHQKHIPVAGDERWPRLAAGHGDAEVLQVMFHNRSGMRWREATHPLERDKSPVDLRPRIVPPMLNSHRLCGVTGWQKTFIRKTSCGTMINRRAGTAEAVEADAMALSYLGEGMSQQSDGINGLNRDDDDETCHFKANA